MPIIVSMSGEYAVDCTNANKHGVPKNRDNYRHFNAKEDQWQYWTKLSYAAKTKILAEHTNDGKCVLCNIDEKLREM
jgi:hypothetical protein